jgi:hypothetical protein
VQTFLQDRKEFVFVDDFGHFDFIAEGYQSFFAELHKKTPTYSVGVRLTLYGRTVYAVTLFLRYALFFPVNRVNRFAFSAFYLDYETSPYPLE